MLKNVRIKKYEVQNEYVFEKPLASDRNNPTPNHSVWDFITKFDGGATYEVTNLNNQNVPPSSVDAAFNQFNKINSGSSQASPDKAKTVGEGI